MAARAIAKDRFGFGQGKAFAIGPVAGHRVVGVYNGDDAGAERDAISFKTVGVASAVESLVVMLDDRVGHPEERHALTDLAAGVAVLFDDGVFVGCKLIGLLEDCVGDGNLADVMESCAEADRFDFPGWQRQGGGIVHSSLF